MAWNDPALQIIWPTDNPELSQRDQTNPRRADIPPDLRPA
ncbi:MAG: hypothetical protein LC792_11555 [Actinobacteria bacterium]|nr:hypothetical protein [Actinomycetota bacterium]